MMNYISNMYMVIHISNLKHVLWLYIIEEQYNYIVHVYYKAIQL